MVIAHHLIWTAYGWRLPNDPRGSSSYEIRVEMIESLGELHHGRKAVQPPSQELRRFYDRAADALKHPLLTFDEQDILLIGQALGKTIHNKGYTCFACAVMPDHVHLLVRRHRDKAEAMLEACQEESRAALVEAGKRSVTHPVWGGRGWKVFLNTVEQVQAVAEYIRDNPLKGGPTGADLGLCETYKGWVPGQKVS